MQWKFFADETEVNDVSDVTEETDSVAIEWKSLCDTQQCACLTPFDYSSRKVSFPCMSIFAFEQIIQLVYVIDFQCHCWKCGQICCVRCMHNQHISLPGHLSKRTVPVCKTCYFKMTGSSFEEHIPWISQTVISQLRNYWILIVLFNPLWYFKA